MKKIMFNIIFVGIISIIVFPFLVSAKSISTLEATFTNGKIMVSGTTENGVLAIATFVYDDDDLLHMETCEVSANKYTCTLNKTFTKGNYIVKVADYDGGDYITDNLAISSSAKEIDSNPKTGDSIINSVILGSVSLLGLLGLGLYMKKRAFNKKKKMS